MFTKLALRRFVLNAAALPVICAAAQQVPSVDEFIVTDHGGPEDSVYTAVAAARERPSGEPQQLHYEVCNRGSKNVVYNWRRPGFQNTIASPLKPTRCALYSLPALNSTKESAPVVYYGLDNQREAIAYLPALSQSGRVKNQLTTTLYMRGIGSGPRPPRQTLPDATVVVKVQVIERDGRLVHEISWSTAVGALALKLPGADQRLRDEVLRQLRGSPMAKQYSAVLTAADTAKSLTGGKPEDLPDSAREGYFVRIVPDDAYKAKGGSVQFSVPASAKSSPSYQPLLIQDEKAQLAFVLQYATLD